MPRRPADERELASPCATEAIAALEPLYLRLALVDKAIDVAQSLRRISRFSYSWPLGGAPNISKAPHSWRDLRLCCHDLRPLLLISEKLHYTKLRGLFGGVSGPYTDIFTAGESQLASVALPGQKGPSLGEMEIAGWKLAPDGTLENWTEPGYLHSSSSLATAYVFGQWSHSTRAEDRYRMGAAFGESAAFIRITDFCLSAGHGLLLVTLALAYQHAGVTPPPVLRPDNVRVQVPTALKELRKFRRALMARLNALQTLAPKKSHQGGL